MISRAYLLADLESRFRTEVLNSYYSWDVLEGYEESMTDEQFLKWYWEVIVRLHMPMG